MEHPAAQVARYMASVLDGTANVGRRERQAVERHLHDLQHATQRGLYFDERKAGAAIIWFPMTLVHIEGEWAGRPVELSDSQVFIVWSIFGWRRHGGLSFYDERGELHDIGYSAGDDAVSLVADYWAENIPGTVNVAEDQFGDVWIDAGTFRSKVEITWPGSRRFRHAYISCARKWGKSTLSAGLALQMLSLDDPLEPGAQIYCAATKEDQAKIVWNLARNMGMESPVLKQHLNFLAKSVTTKRDSYQPHSFLKALGQDSKTADGFNLHGGILDEIHEWMDKHQGLYDKLNTASGSRRQPLVVVITTAGDDKSKLWIVVDTLCCKVLDEHSRDEPPGDNRFVFIARMDEARPCDCGGLNACRKCDGTGEIPEDDILDPKNFRKANPNYPVTPKIHYMMEQAADAKISDYHFNVFKRYHANMKVSSLSKVIHPDTWNAAYGEFLPWEDADAVCGGWDIGGQDDLGAIGLCARFETGQYEVSPETGKPDRARPIYRYEIDAKGFLGTESERDVSKDQWPNWIAQGLLVVTPMELEAMKQEILFEFRENRVRSWAYDPHNSRDFAQTLETTGIETVKFYQNAGMWTEPLRSFLKDLKRGRIRHDGNGLLSWAAQNLVTVNASKASAVMMMPDKASSPDKIDPIVAVMMAYRLATIAPRRSHGKLFIS